MQKLHGINNLAHTKINFSVEIDPCGERIGKINRNKTIIIFLCAVSKEIGKLCHCVMKNDEENEMDNKVTYKIISSWKLQKS